VVVEERVTGKIKKERTNVATVSAERKTKISERECEEEKSRGRKGGESDSWAFLRTIMTRIRR